MDVCVKRCKRFEINDVNELRKFIIEHDVKKYFIDFNNEYKHRIQDKIENTKEIGLKSLKSDFLHEFFTEGSQYRYLFWVERGYTKQIAQQKVSEVQSKNSLKLKIKKEKNPKKYKKIYNTTIEFYTSRGYDIDAAHKLMKARQATFSRSKLIKKYGKDTAERIMEERNARWIDSLERNNDMNLVNKQRGNNGRAKIRTLTEHIEYYGELNGKIKFARRYWGADIKSIIEFDEYIQFLDRDRTSLFYCKTYRERILESQCYKCAECGKSTSDSLFHLHHIDYDKLNDSRENLIFLCHSCHSKTTNTNRDMWINYYTEKNKIYYEA